jgi:opacity protein-like surface antigen
MKKLIILATFFLLLINLHSSAQLRKNTDIFLGPVAGFGDSWVSNMPGTPLFMPSGFAGVEFIGFIDAHFAFGGQLNAAAEGYNYSYGKEDKVRPEYLRLPLRVYYYFGDRTNRVRPDIFVGPAFGYKLSEYKVGIMAVGGDGETSTPGGADIFKNFDTGIDGGAGIAIALSDKTSLKVDLEYYKGFTDVLNDPVDDSDNDSHDFDLSVSLLFRIR